MKVTTNQPEQLVLEHKPFWLPLIFGGGAVFIVFALGRKLPNVPTRDLIGGSLALVGFSLAAIFMGRRTTFTFDARAGEARWSHRGLLGSSEGSLPLAEIRGVAIAEDTHADGPASRVVLDTNSGPLNLTPHYSGIEPHEANADAIRQWLAAYDARDSQK